MCVCCFAAEEERAGLSVTSVKVVNVGQTTVSIGAFCDYGLHVNRYL